MDKKKPNPFMKMIAEKKAKATGKGGKDKKAMKPMKGEKGYACGGKVKK